ncbi:putative quinol monooxygenase [Marivivens marinus]|uniref:putative quinol monooxygenase n=1 Tax=Marivivens marinus TaxID=3110173 RepID=UPI003B847FA1
MTPGYTFMSKSTAKPGMLDDLVRIASAPPQAMEGVVEGLIGYQVAVDADRNAVVVWSTFRDKAALYDYLASDAAKGNHGDPEEMERIIETFEMYDLTPTVGKLPA